MRVGLLALAGIILTAASFHAIAQQDQIERMTTSKMENFEFDKLDWKDEPVLPGDAKSALVIGDPTKPGVFMVYLKFPPKYEIPAHTHPFTEVVTILKGEAWNGMGEKLDRTKGDKLGAGSSFTLPAKHAHYLWNEEETIVLLTATGPWGITYIDQKDDPRK